MQVDIKVPNDYDDYGISPGDFYYALLSAFDSAASYDQIGLTAYYGNWGLTWQALTNCGADKVRGVTYDPFVLVLNRGATYSFRMTISGGVVTFSLWKGSQVWSLQKTTGGTVFVLDQTYVCNGGSWGDYTNFEEIWNIQNGEIPSWSFFFTNNLANGASTTAWNPYSWRTDVRAFTSGSSVTVANQWFSGSVAWDNMYVPFSGSAQTATDYGTVSVLYYVPDCQQYGGVYCEISVIPWTGPVGWSVVVTPNYKLLTPGTPTSFSFTLAVSLPGSTPSAYYWNEVKIYDHFGKYTKLGLVIQVGGSGGGGGGGGGCVAYDTPVLTDRGYVPVQYLDPGDTVIGYDLAFGRFISLRLVSNGRSWGYSLIRINDGQLLVTAVDQPIFIKNQTYQGWVRDAQNLTVGDLMFDAMNGQWVPIFSLVHVQEKAKVYDVRTDGPNDFIANGFLLDSKLP